MNNRREFLLSSGMAAGGAVLGAVQLVASEPQEGTVEREISAVISRYGRSVAINRDRHSIEFKVKIHSVERFSRTFDPGHLPFDQIHVGENNTLKCNHRGVDFSIVNVA